MIASNGIGISAVQIDELKRVFLVLIPRELDELDENGDPKTIQLNYQIKFYEKGRGAGTLQKPETQSV